MKSRCASQTAQPSPRGRPVTGMRRRHHGGHQPVVEGRDAARRLHAAGAGGRQVPPHRFLVEAEPLGHPLLRHARQPQPQDLFDLKHRDLAKSYRRLPSVDGCSVASRSRRWRGNASANPRSEGGIVLPPTRPETL